MLDSEEIDSLYELYTAFILHGKKNLLDYLGKTSSHPSWVSTKGGRYVFAFCFIYSLCFVIDQYSNANIRVTESFAPSLSVCHRNRQRSVLLDLFEKVRAEYFNEIWQCGELVLYIGMAVTLPG